MAKDKRKIYKAVKKNVDGKDCLLIKFKNLRPIDIRELRNEINILTTDTHEPGFIDEKCENDAKDSNTNILPQALSCTSSTLLNFIKFVHDNFSEDTAIIMLGDHLYPQKSHIKTVTSEKERTIYNRIISKNILIQRNLINHYDLFPTILNLLNFTFANNRLGLGFSAIKKVDINFYNNFFKELQNNIQNKSSYYVTFWK